MTSLPLPREIPTTGWKRVLKTFCLARPYPFSCWIMGRSLGSRGRGRSSVVLGRCWGRGLWLWLFAMCRGYGKSTHVCRNLRMDFLQVYFHDIIVGVYMRRTLDGKLGNIGARLGFIIFLLHKSGKVTWSIHLTMWRMATCPVCYTKLL